MKETNEIDTYIRLKYGYPLTEESYKQMPDDLIELIYNAVVPNSIIRSNKHRRNIIIVDFDLQLKNIDIWSKSDTVWKTIIKYYEQQNR